jgi:nuclear cap-binding protein subunit 2
MEGLVLDHFVPSLEEPSSYRDRKYEGSVDEQELRIHSSATLYIGNLSFFTTEEQIHAHFCFCGHVKRIVMGLDRNKKTPCGFAFVEYFDRQGALLAKSLLDGSKLDERFIRIDIDAGFIEGRQFGRGRSGGQVRDEFRLEYDAGRGGWGPKLPTSLPVQKSVHGPSKKQHR